LTAERDRVAEASALRNRLAAAVGTLTGQVNLLTADLVDRDRKIARVSEGHARLVDELAARTR
jgi:hypothetical protein